MDAHKLCLLRDFIGENKILFSIPVYQRNYDWGEDNCKRLLEDIKTIIDTGYKHFLGAIVYMSSKEGGFTLREYTIIDGQQRLTTIMIMLKAISDVAKQVNDNCYEEIEEQYLHNKYCSEEFKVKLKPIKSDNQQFLLLLNAKEEDMDEETHIYKNYKLCKELFIQWNKDGISPSIVLDALTKLEIVEIVLTKGEDDPQLIFESINSTGLDLSNSDLIRNYLLMNSDNQERLYEDYWLSIEKTLRNKMDYSNLDAFFMQYIVYKTNKPITSKKLYTSFVNLFKFSNYSQEEILKELKYYAEIFGAFIYGREDYSENINKLLKKIRFLNQTTCYPFLLHVFNDYHKHIIDSHTVEKILHFILSYLLRRMVCGVPSNSLRGVFIYLYNRIFKVATNKQKYYESINKFFFTISSKDVMPPDAEFKKALLTANIYANNSLCRFLLLDIENGDCKEALQAETLTIEHIMPQTLSADWNYITPEDHENFLHTLGNLSITGYNSELSNKNFKEKQEIIRENSKAVILNSDILDKQVWDINCIKSRAKRLINIIMDRYKITRINDETIEFDYIRTLTLNNYNDVTNTKLVSFKLFDETYRQNKYALMLADVVKLLDKKYPGKLEKLANQIYSFSNVKKERHDHINSSGNNMRNALKIKDDVYIEINLSASTCIRFIKNLMSEFGVDENQFSFNIVDEDQSDILDINSLE